MNIFEKWLDKIKKEIERAISRLKEKLNPQDEQEKEDEKEGDNTKPQIPETPEKPNDGNGKDDKPPVDTKPQIPEGDIDLSNADWKRIDGRKAKTTERITKLTFDGKYFVIETTAGTKAWRPMNDECNQYACFFVIRNGRWTGGKFDWQRPSNTKRDTKNILSGYTGGIIPVKGEDVAYCQINLNLTERTNCVIVKWK